MSGEGTVLARDTTQRDPDQIAAFVDQYAPDAERVVHESGIMAIWLTRELSKRGVPVICIDARLAHKALSGRINKTDRGDVEGLAHLAHTGWLTPVHIRSEASERVRVLIGTRERLIRMRKDLEAHVRGVLKTFGIKMTAIHRSSQRRGFRDQLAGAGQSDLAIELMADAFNPIHKALCAAADAVDDELREIARSSDLAQRLQTMPGIGPITALAIGTFAPPMQTFKCGRSFASWLGLVPRQHSSGEKARLGRMSKAGQADIRRLLITGAMTRLNWLGRKRIRPGSWLALMLARKPRLIVAIALANKMARAIWAMLTPGQNCQGDAALEMA